MRDSHCSLSPYSNMAQDGFISHACFTTDFDARWCGMCVLLLYFLCLNREALHDELSSVHASVSDGPTFLNFLPIITRYSNQEALDVLAA
jgi:hypothetical protein